MARRTLTLLLLISCIAAITVADNGEAPKSEPSAVAPEPTTVEPTTTEPTTTTEEDYLPPARPTCEDPREVYNECGSACDNRTCENLRRADMQCTKQCIEGCFCRSGYVRDDQDRCIPAYRCGKTF